MFMLSHSLSPRYGCTFRPPLLPFQELRKLEKFFEETECEAVAIGTPVLSYVKLGRSP